MPPVSLIFGYSCCLPAAVRHSGTTVRPSYRQAIDGFVNEDDPGQIEGELAVWPEDQSGAFGRLFHRPYGTLKRLIRSKIPGRYSDLTGKSQMAFN